jgi:hypothetical protein
VYENAVHAAQSITKAAGVRGLFTASISCVMTSSTGGEDVVHLLDGPIFRFGLTFGNVEQLMI